MTFWLVDMFWKPFENLDRVNLYHAWRVFLKFERTFEIWTSTPARFQSSCRSFPWWYKAIFLYITALTIIHYIIAMVFRVSVNASFSEGFLEKCWRFHSNGGHFKEEFILGNTGYKYVTWIDCKSKFDFWFFWGKQIHVTCEDPTESMTVIPANISGLPRYKNLWSFLCFVTIMFVLSFVLTSLFSLFYVTREGVGFYTEDEPIFRRRSAHTTPNDSFLKAGLKRFRKDSPVLLPYSTLRLVWHTLQTSFAQFSFLGQSHQSHLCLI